MIDLLIFELLRRKGRVVVPNLGAFFIKEEQFSNEKESGSFTVLFSDSLHFNDGILISHLKRIEGLSLEEAEKQVEKYVSDLQNKLTAGNRHIISNLGYLQIENGQLSFHQTHQPTLDQGLSINEPASSQPQPTVTNSQAEIQVPESPLHDPKPEEPTSAERIDSFSEQESEEQLIETKSEEPKQEENIELEPEEPTTLNLQPTTYNLQPTTHNLEPTTHNLQPTTHNLEPTARNYKPTLLILILLLVIVAVTFGVAWWFDLLPITEKTAIYEPEPIESVTQDTEQNQWFEEEKNETILVDSMKVDSIPTEIPENMEPEVFDTLAFLRENSFHIVAASCNNPQLAKETLEELHGKGYDQCMIVHQTDGKFRVTYASFSNRAEAMVALEKIRMKENQPDVWLLVYTP